MNLKKKKDLARRILGVSKDANLIEIKKSFWILAMQYHPDKNPCNEEAHKTFHNIVNAYEFLAKGETRGWDPKDKDIPPGEERIGEYLSNEWGYFCWWQDNYHETEKASIRQQRKRPTECDEAESHSGDWW